MFGFFETSRAATPPGFSRYDEGRSRLWVRDGWREPLARFDLADTEQLVAQYPAGLAGRGGLALLVIPSSSGPPERLVLRPYHRGGLIGLLLRDRYLDRLRALSELKLYEEAARRGLPSLEAIAALTRPCPFLGYRHAIITRLLPDAQDLASCLRTATQSARRSALAASGHAVRLMHERGFDHPDLNLKNILVRQGSSGWEALVIDFDRGNFAVGPLCPDRRRGNLMRLLRSMVKLQARESGTLKPRDALVLARGYFGTDAAARSQFIREARRALASGLRLRFTSWRTTPEEP